MKNNQVIYWWRRMTVERTATADFGSMPSARLWFRVYGINAANKVRCGSLKDVVRWEAQVCHPKDNEGDPEDCGVSEGRLFRNPQPALERARLDYLQKLRKRKKKLRAELRAIERFEKAARKV